MKILFETLPTQSHNILKIGNILVLNVASNKTIQINNNSINIETQFTNSWNSIVITYNHITSNIKLYLNNIFIFNHREILHSNTDYDIVLFNNSSIPSSEFSTILIDDFRLYNYVITY